MLVRQRQEVQEVPPRFRRAPGRALRGRRGRAEPRSAEDRRRHRGREALGCCERGRTRLRGRAHRARRDHRADRYVGARLHRRARRHPRATQLRGLPEKRVHLRQRGGVPRHSERRRGAHRGRHRERGLLHHPGRLLLRFLPHVLHRRGIARSRRPGARDQGSRGGRIESREALGAFGRCGRRGERVREGPRLHGGARVRRPRHRPGIPRGSLRQLRHGAGRRPHHGAGHDVHHRAHDQRRRPGDRHDRPQWLDRAHSR